MQTIVVAAVINISGDSVRVARKLFFLANVTCISVCMWFDV